MLMQAPSTSRGIAVLMHNLTVDKLCGKHKHRSLWLWEKSPVRYKPEGRGFDSRWSHEFFSNLILPVALWLWGRLSL
jgi:hypothetical protein